MGPRRSADNHGGDHEINLWHEQTLPNAPYDDDEPTCCDNCMRPLNVILTIMLLTVNLGAVGIGAFWLWAIQGKPFDDCLIMLLAGTVCVGAGTLLAVFGTIPCICQLANRQKSFLSQAKCCSKCCRLIGFIIFPVIAILLGVTMDVGGTFFVMMYPTVPSLTRDLSSAPGITAPVKITRDTNGIPHIVGENMNDVIFAQGFAVAEDRLWQIEFLRLVGNGRLAEFVGDAGLKMDKQTRTLNFKQAAKSLCDAASEADRALIQRYIDGINFYLSSYTERPPEFMIMSTQFMFYHRPEQFVVDDTCMLARLLQWQLGTNINSEMERWKVFWNTARTMDEINELYINQTNITNTILSAQDMNITEQDAVDARAREASDNTLEKQIYEEYFYPRRAAASSSSFSSSKKKSDRHLDLFDLMHLEASNAWAARAAGAATSIGASDPHLQITLPSVWYYSHLSFKFNDPNNGNALTQHDVGGVGLPGIPGVHIGKSTHVSWGITMSMTDLIDLWVLVPDPANPETHYLHNNVSVAFTTRSETIKVKMGSDVTIQVKDSLYGPVVTKELEIPGPFNMALTSQGLLDDSTSLHAILSMISPNITTAVEMRDNVLLQVKMPGFSIPIIDDQNNLVYSMTGQHVKRAPGHTGRFPMIGNGTYDYLGNIPMNELPTLHIPPTESQTTGRYIAAANNKIYPDGYQYTLGYDYAYPYREGRIHQLLADNVPTLSTLATHMSIQKDIRSNYAVRMLSILNNTAAYPEAAAFRAALNAAGNNWFATLLTGWDRLAAIGSSETSFFWLWARQLLQIPVDANKAIDENYWSEDYAMSMLTNPTAKMQASCAATMPGGTGTCGQAAARYFNQQAASYEYKSWGVDLNQLLLKNLMLHGTPFACFLERTTNKDGDFSSIDVADASLDDDITTSAASSVRQIFDWSSPSALNIAFPGGMSGNPFSKYFQNLLEGFVADQYTLVTVVNDPAGSLASGGAESQTLSP